MPKKGANISLSSYDDIFETDASRAEAKQERIQSISILDLVPFENHPFKVVGAVKISADISAIERWVSAACALLFTGWGNKA